MMKLGTPADSTLAAFAKIRIRHLLLAARLTKMVHQLRVEAEGALATLLQLLTTGFGPKVKSAYVRSHVRFQV
jgi:hypothetical protein